MPRLNPVQVAEAARAGGFTGPDVAVAVAVAWAESGWNTDAVNTGNANGTADYGLWQINSVHRFPELAGGQWKDPTTNARMAKRVHDRQGWGAWVAYGNSSYQAALGQAQAAAGEVVDSVTTTPGEVVDSVAGVLAPVAEAANNVSGAIEWLQQPESWARIARVAGGAALLILGAWIILTPLVGGTATKVVGIVTDVAPQTRTVKAGARAAAATSNG